MAANATVGLLRAVVALDAGAFQQGARATAGAARVVTGSFGAVREAANEVAEGIVDLTGLIGRAGQAMTRFGRNWTLGVSLPIAGAAGVALKFATEFETSISRLSTLSDVAVKDVAAMRAGVLALAPAVGIGPEKLAAALLKITSTGIRGKEALDILRKSAEASAIGLGDVADVASALTSIMAAYGKTGLTAAQATDQLVQAVIEGKAEASELAPAIGGVVGLAAQMGVSFAQTGAFIATFTRLGGSADEAVTALRGTLNNILNPAEGVTKALAGAGLSAEGLRQSLRERGLTATLLDLVDRFRDNESALGAIIPNVRALTGVLNTAAAQGEDFAKVQAKIEDATGVTARKFEENSRLTAFSLSQLQAKARAVAIEFGTHLTPAFNALIDAARPVLNLVGGLVNLFGKLPQPVQTVAIGVGVLAVAIGPLAIALGSLAKTVAILATLNTLNTILGLMTGRVTAAALASTGLSGGVAALGGWLARVSAPLTAFLRSILTLGGAFRFLMGLVGGAVSLFVRLGVGMFALIATPKLIVAAFIALALSSKDVREVLGDLLSIVISLSKMLINLGQDALTLLTERIQNAIRHLVLLKQWAEENIPGFKTLTEGMSKAKTAIHDTAVTLDELATRMEAMPAATERVVDSITNAKVRFEEYNRTMHDETALANRVAADSLRKLIERLDAAKVSGQNLTDLQKRFLTLAIQEGTMSIEEMATAARTTTGAVENFKKQLTETAREASTAADKLRDLRDEMSGKEILDTARRYETVLRAVGGAQRLTADQGEDFLKVFDAVIAKYRLVSGPDAARIVAHYEGLREQFRQTDAGAQRYLENERRGYEASILLLEARDAAGREHLENEMRAVDALDVVALAYLANEERVWKQSIELLKDRDEAGNEFLRAEQARLAALEGTRFEDPFSREMARARRVWRRLADDTKQAFERLQDDTLGRMGTIFFGFGHDLNGELRQAAREAELEYLKIQRSGRATAKELQVAFERWREAEDRANFTFAERMRQVWISIKTFIVDVLNDVLRYFTGQFLTGLIKGIAGARLGQSLGAAVAGGLGFAGQAALAGGVAAAGGAAAAGAAATTVIAGTGIPTVAGAGATGLGAGAAGAGGLGAGLAAFATNPITIGVAAGIGGFLLARKLAGGGEEAEVVNPRRDKFQLQFGGPPVSMGGMALAGHLTRITGAPGGGALFAALQQADTAREFEAAQANIVKVLASGGVRARSYQFGGFVPPGTIMPAILHGGRRGEDVIPRTMATPEARTPRNIVINHNIRIEGMLDRAGASAFYREVILPMEKQALELNTDDILTIHRRTLQP